MFFFKFETSSSSALKLVCIHFHSYKTTVFGVISVTVLLACNIASGKLSQLFLKLIDKLQIIDINWNASLCNRQLFVQLTLKDMLIICWLLEYATLTCFLHLNIIASYKVNRFCESTAHQYQLFSYSKQIV